MKKDVLPKVLGFMGESETKEMSSNEFVWNFARYINSQHNDIMVGAEFRNMPSVESILRSRRKVISDYGFGKRTKADTQEEYIDEFARSDRYKS